MKNTGGSMIVGAQDTAFYGLQSVGGGLAGIESMR
jgi:hypothetical protein